MIGPAQREVLQATQRAQASLADLLEGVTLFPQTLLNVRLPSLADWQNNAHLAAETRAVEAVTSLKEGDVITNTLYPTGSAGLRQTNPRPPSTGNSVSP